MSTTIKPVQQNSLHNPLEIENGTMIKEISKPLRHITSATRGKAIREHLAEVFRYWIQIDDDKFEKILNVIFFVHNSTLLVDDIQDSSELRRGVPAAHTLYGIPRTLLAVMWSQSSFFGLIEYLHNMELGNYVSKTMCEIVAGQGQELCWRDTHICPTETEYIQMVYRKTGLIFTMVLTAMNTFSTSKKLDAYRFIKAFGIYFQINDDYQNLHNKSYHNSKGFCEDISEGKFSFPIVHAINNFPNEGEIIKDILKMRTSNVEEKKRCLLLLEKCGSFEYTRKKLEELKAVIYEEIAKFGENPLLKDFLVKAIPTLIDNTR